MMFLEGLERMTAIALVSSKKLQTQNVCVKSSEKPRRVCATADCMLKSKGD